MTASTSDHMLALMRRLIALELWRVGAIKVNVPEPFRLVSGNYSPIYINCRQLISSPAFVDLFVAGARLICDRHHIEFDLLAGGETAGIPFAAFLARAFGAPMIYVRKRSKEHGTRSIIEGVLPHDASVLLVEDLITDAGSKLAFVHAIEDAGGQVENVLVAFDRLQGGRQALADVGVRLHSTTDMDVALAEAKLSGTLAAGAMNSVQEYLSSPASWHAARGLPYVP